MELSKEFKRGLSLQFHVVLDADVCKKRDSGCVVSTRLFQWEGAAYGGGNKTRLGRFVAGKSEFSMFGEQVPIFLIPKRFIHGVVGCGWGS